MKGVSFIKVGIILAMINIIHSVEGDSNTTTTNNNNISTNSIGCINCAEKDEFNLRNSIGLNDISSLLNTLSGEIEQKPNINNIIPALTGPLDQIKIAIIENLSSIGFNPFTLFNTFIKVWKSSIPTIAPIGSFTLLQAALLLAIGCLAAGAAVVVGEAFYFKTLNEEEELLHHHLRRDYNLHYGITTPKPSTPYYTHSKRKYKPQSLKRTQRRNQRKNKNAGEQLDNYKRIKAAKATTTVRRRQKRYIIHPFTTQYPTVAPRPDYFQQPMRRQDIQNQQPMRYQVNQPPPVERIDNNIFSLKSIINFITRHGINLMNWIPLIPGFSNNSRKSDNNIPPNRPIKRSSLNPLKNMISRPFKRYPK